MADNEISCKQIGSLILTPNDVYSSINAVRFKSGVNAF